MLPRYHDLNIKINKNGFGKISTSMLLPGVALHHQLVLIK